MTSRADVILQGTVRLIAAGVPEPERDARRLFRWASGLDAAGLAVAIRDPARPAEIARFETAIDARVDRVPVSQITGRRAFWGREFRVSADVLDPRPETETLVAAALERRWSSVLDLGTGSGCILLTLVAERPGASGLGTDLSERALAVARANAEELGLGARARFVTADWFAGIAGRFDLIVSNPPYIAEAEIAGLAPEVRLHEPRMALTPGGDGLAAYRAIAAGAAAHLARDGALMVEVGASQAEAVAALFREAGLAPEPPRHDLEGKPRVVVATPAGAGRGPLRGQSCP